MNIESHPFLPFYPPHTRMIMCGTFPPKSYRWSMEFFYPNFTNDMWRIYGLIFLGNKDALVDTANKTFKLKEIKELLTKYHIGVGETVVKAIRERDNASDKYLKVIEPMDLEKELSKNPECIAIVTTGEKAASVVATISGTKLPEIGQSLYLPIKNSYGEPISHWRMPSTSRAYPMKLDKKAFFYKEMMKSIGIIP